MESESIQGLMGLHAGGVSIQIAFNLVSSVVLGGIIGLERSARGRQAGMRTYAIVSLASACMMSAISQEASMMSIGDPASRVIQGLLTGLGFLGGGVIMQNGMRISGLTTAASIWLTAGIGITCGLSMSGLGLFVTVAALAILAGLKYVEARMSKDSYATVAIKLPVDTAMGEAEVKELLRAEGLRTIETAFRRDKAKCLEFEMSVLYTEHEAPNRLAKKLISMNGQIESFKISASPD